ncbi:MAG: phage recombination protein Bet [Candidatus Dormibacteria bacterium]
MPDTKLVDATTPPSGHGLAQPMRAGQLTRDQFTLLKRTLGNVEMSDDEFTLFMVEAARLGLDPVTHQIVPVMFYSAKRQRQEMTIIITITGMRSLCQRTGKEDGTDGPEFTEDGLNWTKLWMDDDSQPKAARFTIYRKGMAHPYEGVAKWSEFVKKDRSGRVERFWRDMPQHMLGKCAEAVARRMAFSDELQGVYVAEEFGGTTPEQAVEAVKSRGVGTAPPAAQAALPAPRPVEPEPRIAAMVAQLYNSLERASRPPIDYLQAVGKQEGRGAQVRDLIAAHRLAHDQCEHVTDEMREVAVASVGGKAPGAADDGGEEAENDLVEEVGGDALPGLNSGERPGHGSSG